MLVSRKSKAYMGNEGSVGLAVDVAASSIEMSAVLDGGSAVIWLVVGLILAWALWGRKFARRR